MYSQCNLKQVFIVADYSKHLPSSKIVVFFPNEEQPELLCSSVDNKPAVGDYTFHMYSSSEVCIGIFLMPFCD